MRKWAYKINQWNLWQRGSLLFLLLAVLWAAWYFFLERPLLENNKAMVEQQVYDQAVAKELSTLIGLQVNFVYKNELQAVQLKQVFQNALPGSSGLTMISYVDNPAVSLPAGASQFAQVAAALHVSLLNSIKQSSATMVFSGEFNSFVAYLQALEGVGDKIYFDSLDFNMNRYPKAEITMKIFTLKGA